MPAQRPMDNMAAGWDRPQEDEFALCNLGLPSPYLTLALPNTPQCTEYIDMQGIPPEALQRWKQTLLWFLKTLTAQESQADRAQVAAAHGPDSRLAGDVPPSAVRPHLPRPLGRLSFDDQSLEADVYGPVPAKVDRYGQVWTIGSLFSINLY